MRIFVFEGPNNLYPFESGSAAGGYLEAIDVEEEEYVAFGDDGTVMRLSVSDGRVVVTPTAERRPDELRERLRVYLSQTRAEADPALAEDPAALAEFLVELEHPRRRSPWFRRWRGGGGGRS